MGAIVFFGGVAGFDYTKDVIVSLRPKVCACFFLCFFLAKSYVDPEIIG